MGCLSEKKNLVGKKGKKKQSVREKSVHMERGRIAFPLCQVENRGTG